MNPLLLISLGLALLAIGRGDTEKEANGSGPTTLLRVRRGLYYPYYGQFKNSQRQEITRNLGYKQLMELLSDANEYLDNRRPGGVTCMPLGHCSCIYGTEAEHFQYYGFVGPTESNCLTQDGLVLCIDAANPCVGPPNPPEPEPVQPVHVHPVQPIQTIQPVQPDKPVQPVHVHPVQPDKPDEPDTWTWSPWTTEPTTPKPSYGNGVNIIGPSPTYNNYAVVQGPQVHYTQNEHGQTVFKKIVPGKVHWSQWKPSQNHYYSVNNKIAH